MALKNEPITAWLVEVDVVDPDRSEPYAQTLICESYDGTPGGAAHWAADVLDWCEVYVRSVRRVHGQVVEARDRNRIDEAPAGHPAGILVEPPPAARIVEVPFDDGVRFAIEYRGAQVTATYRHREVLEGSALAAWNAIDEGEVEDLAAAELADRETGSVSEDEYRQVAAKIRARLAAEIRGSIEVQS